MSVDPEPPPLYRTGPCDTLREAGFKHGQAAAARIRAFLNTDEISLARTFVAGPDAEGAPGAGMVAAFNALREENTRAFPDYAQEIEGIAEGASVSADDIWLVNLLAEVQALMGLPIGKRIERCSDVMLRGASGRLWHGHNEDWPGLKYHNLVYFVAYDSTNGSNFVPVMGMCYPGMIPGFAMTWAANGLLLTQNSLFPPAVRRRGYGCTFVARRALEESSIELSILRLIAPGQALGCNVNLVSIQGEPKACCVEVHGTGNSSAVRWLAPEHGSTLLHFNVYSTMAVGNSNNPRNSSARHARAASLLVGAPRSDSGGAMDVISVLGDSKTSTAFPIFRTDTLLSWLVDTERRRVTVWHGRPGKDAPLYQWDVDTFFGSDSSTKTTTPRDRVVQPLQEKFLQDVSSPFYRNDGNILPVQRGVHKLDLFLRQVVSKEVKEVLRSSRDPAAAMAEVSALRKNLLREVRTGELSEAAALQGFRREIKRLLQEWPLDAGNHELGLTTTNPKVHEVDLLLQKEAGRVHKSFAGNSSRGLTSAKLSQLRQDIMRKVCSGTMPEESAVEHFRSRAAQMAEEAEQDGNCSMHVCPVLEI